MSSFPTLIKALTKTKDPEEQEQILSDLSNTRKPSIIPSASVVLLTKLSHSTHKPTSSLARVVLDSWGKLSSPVKKVSKKQSEDEEEEDEEKTPYRKMMRPRKSSSSPSAALTSKNEKQKKEGAKVKKSGGDKVTEAVIETKEATPPTIAPDVKVPAGGKVPATGNTFPPPVIVHPPVGTDTGVCDRERICVLRDEGNSKGKDKGTSGPVVYWMSRDQRVQDNWALHYALHLASTHSTNCVVLFNVAPFLNAPLRHYSFMFDGLEDVEKILNKLGYEMFVVCGEPVESVSAFINHIKARALVTDFSPLRISRMWKTSVAKNIACPFYEVDTHNIVPPWKASDKQEWAAVTFRARLQKHLDKYLIDIPALASAKKMKKSSSSSSSSSSSKLKIYGGDEKIDWKSIRGGLKCDPSVKPVNWIKAGPTAAEAALENFLSARLKKYSGDRNVPHLNSLSHLSPYFHYGSIAPHRAAYNALQFKAKSKEGFESFFEELVVRRELSDNFCHYNLNYDRYEGLPPWAQITHKEHAKDPRPTMYTDEQMEKGKTGDELWNACQLEMVYLGKMHGYMRMYWAKKIMEWTPSAQHALAFSIQQNDKFELDGRDPNGYVGCCWAIGGVHDRAWTERAIFGKIRYMNYAGCKRKFDVPAYVARIQAAVKSLKP